MKEHKLPPQSFIKGYYIDPKICDDIVDIQKKHNYPQRVLTTTGKNKKEIN